MLMVAFDFMSTLSRMLAHMSKTNQMESLIRLLDVADALPGAVALRARSYDLLTLHDGAAVVDVGCGAGRAVDELEERGMKAIGVDVSEEMIAAARHRWPQADFRIGDAFDLPLEDGEVAGYRADKVYHELADAAKALEEAKRVLAPGGRIVLIGQDWDTFIIDSDDPALTRTIVHARADMNPNPRAARRYRNLLLDTGFQDVQVEAHVGVFTDAAMLPMLTGIAEGARVAGAITPEQETAWVTEQTERARSGRMFLALPIFVASASRSGE
ncbi:methyltransferase domain-containing protein [Nonomuraea sp. CA-141351]|uniref:methyltransferase domain-containing protein n=1 Tax=Nonomuraea sp. CA-141351 TaxID=3239996 RepID=UPI003D8FC69F